MYNCSWLVNPKKYLMYREVVPQLLGDHREKFLRGYRSPDGLESRLRLQPGADFG